MVEAQEVENDEMACRLNNAVYKHSTVQEKNTILEQKVFELGVQLRMMQNKVHMAEQDSRRLKNEANLKARQITNLEALIKTIQYDKERVIKELQRRTNYNFASRFLEGKFLRLRQIQEIAKTGTDALQSVFVDVAKDAMTQT